MSYFVNPLRLNYTEDKFVLNKVIVFLSRSPRGENVLILFPLKLKNCKVHPLIKSFTEFLTSNHENRGKKYQITNGKVTQMDEEINHYDRHHVPSYYEYKQMIVLNNTCKYMVNSLKKLNEI